MRLLDNVIDVSRFPLPAQRQEAHGQAAHRAGGDGTGRRADLLPRALRFARKHGPDRPLARDAVSHAAYDASADLAAEKGAFPLFDRDEYLARPNIAALPQAIRDKIAAHGIRNALVTSIAPTGTISLFADNVSSGIEPVFAYSYTPQGAAA